MESNDRLLTPKGLASRLAMSVPWVYKQVEKGSLPFVRLGEAIRFDPEEIGAYLQTRRNIKKEKTKSLE
jgi:excisionase family DNA binding protein